VAGGQREFSKVAGDVAQKSLVVESGSGPYRILPVS
jgi:hypothetical protein